MKLPVPCVLSLQACVKFREMSGQQDSITLTTSAEDRFGYSAQFFYGVLLAIVGSSLQALGLCLWKLHSTGRHSQRIIEESGNTCAHNGRELLLHEDLCNDHVDDSVSRCDEVLSVSGPNDQTPRIRAETASGRIGDKTAIVERRDHETSRLLYDRTKPQRICHCQCASWRNFSCMWLSGFCVIILGNVCDFVALGIAPLSVVTLLGSWSLVVNPLAAHFLLHEVVTFSDLLSIVLIVAGIVTTVLASDHSPNDWPLGQLIRHYREPKVIILLIGLASVLLASLLVIHFDWVKHRKYSGAMGRVAADGPGKYIRLLYVMVGSVVANFTALFGKAFSGLLVITFSGQDEFNDPFAVMIVVVFAVSLPLQIHLINCSLEVNDILYHIPNFYVFWNIGNIAIGAVFYDETAHFSVTNWALCAAGVGMLVFGVLCTNIAATRRNCGSIVQSESISYEGTLFSRS